MRLESEGPKPPKGGLILLQGLILAFFFIFLLRLWYLQIYQGESFAAKAQDNRLRRQTMFAPRGMIRDKNGLLLAINEPAYALAIVREDCNNLNATIEQVSKWSGIELDPLRKTFERGRLRTKPFEDQIIVPNMTFELISQVEGNAMSWPGLKILVRTKRNYPEGQVMSHVLGYVSEAGEDELNADPELAMGDSVGKQGLELVFEKHLRGRKGIKQVEVDAAGRHLNDYQLSTPKAGDDLTLSIDLGLQRLASEKLQGGAGAVVVLDADTGQVVALVGEPSFDNNTFIGGISPDKWKELLTNPRHPLQSRAIQSMFPPGSVYKLLMAACGLSEGRVKPSETTSCSGAFQMGSVTFRCWKKQGHGSVNLIESLTQSCDVYYYTLGDKLGIDKISNYAKASGFGEKTGIDLPNEKAGLVPSREWKRKRYKDRWHRGETINISIGQGYNLVTPIQIARFIAALLNGGRILKPNLIMDAPPTLQGTLPLKEEHRRMILDAMVATVERGTARSIRKEGVVLGAKTGTAQVVKIGEERKKVQDMAYEHRDHAWIATFGQKGGRNYVVVVMVEHGGHGAEAAGPIAKAVYDYLFDDKPKRIVPSVKQQTEAVDERNASDAGGAL